MMDILLSLLSFYLSFKITPKKITQYLELRGATDRPALEYVAPEAVRAAAVQLPRRKYDTFCDYAGEMYKHVHDAANAGAHLVVFPEYTGLLAATLIPFGKKLLKWVLPNQETGPVPAHAVALAETFAGFLEEIYLCTFGTIARLQKVYLVAGSCLFYENGVFFHRSMVFGPNGDLLGAQEKLCPLGLDQSLGVSAGQSIKLFDTAIGKFGVLCGTDAYYPEFFQILSAKGACMVAVPDAHGDVLRDLLRCRAQEYGLYVIYACIPDEASESIVRSSLLAPEQATPEHDGIIAQIHEPKAGAISARLNLNRLHICDVRKADASFLAGDYLNSYRNHMKAAPSA